MKCEVCGKEIKELFRSAKVKALKREEANVCSEKCARIWLDK